MCGNSHAAEGIGKETAEQLVAAVSQRLFPQLETLNVADNDMGTAITVELLKSLRAGFCPQLRHLVMHDNRIGSSVGSLLAELLAEDSKCALKTLDVKHNRLKEGMATIVESIAFRVNTTLETFLFADNDETKAVVTRFIELLAEGHLPNLQHVEWSTACSSPFSVDLLQRIRANAPSLSLLLTNVSCSLVSRLSRSFRNFARAAHRSHSAHHRRTLPAGGNHPVDAGTLDTARDAAVHPGGARLQTSGGERAHRADPHDRLRRRGGERDGGDDESPEERRVPVDPGDHAEQQYGSRAKVTRSLHGVDDLRDDLPP